MDDDDSDEESKMPAAASFQKAKKVVYSLDVASLPTITMIEVLKHKSRESAWTVVDGLVYDVTTYIPYHPGGKKIMLGVGKEASTMFRKCHNKS